MLIAGSYSIAKFEEIYDLYFGKNTEKLLSELPHMVSPANLQTRAEQVELSAKVDHCHKGAEIMLDMQKLYKLTGDFSDMHHVLESVSDVLVIVTIGWYTSVLI